MVAGFYDQAMVASDRGDCEKARRVLQPWLDVDGGADAEARATLRSCGPDGRGRDAE